MELLGKNKHFSEKKTQLDLSMKKFEKETKNVQKRLRKIGDIIEKAKNILTDKKILLRKAKENSSVKT